MRDFINGILGAYEPISYPQDHFIYSPEQPGVIIEEIYADIIPAGLAGVDWSYVISGLAFLIVLYCLFKTLGGLICRIF